MSALVEAEADSSGTAPVDIRTVKLISNDGEEFMVPAAIAKLSKMICTGIEGKIISYV